MEMEEVNKLYRCTTYQIADCHEIKLDTKEYQIIKKTPKGYWIWIGYGLYSNLLCDMDYISNKENKFSATDRKERTDYTKSLIRKNSKYVSNWGRNRFAYPTKEEALFNFQKRKEKEIKILEHKLWFAEKSLKKVKAMLVNSETKIF